MKKCGTCGQDLPQVKLKVDFETAVGFKPDAGYPVAIWKSVFGDYEERRLLELDPWDGHDGDPILLTRETARELALFILKQLDEEVITR